MENEISQKDHEDRIDREVRKLFREMDEGEYARRAMIELLVMLGSDAMLEFDV